MSGLNSLIEPIFPISVLQLITTLVWQSGLAPSLEIARFRVRFSERPPRKDSFRGATERGALLSFFTHSPRGKEPVTQAVFQERYRGRTKVGVVIGGWYRGRTKVGVGIFWMLQSVFGFRFGVWRGMHGSNSHLFERLSESRLTFANIGMKSKEGNFNLTGK